MVACVDTVHRWNERYAGDEYLYGEAPNAFLRANAHRLAAGQSALCVADGDGRNSVWLAERGLRVTAFDFAQTSVAKARRLAMRQGVTVDFRVCDIFDWSWVPDRFDIVVGIYAIACIQRGHRMAEDEVFELAPQLAYHLANKAYKL